MHKSKLKSFTLSEMLVVMIITAIVMGIAFSVLRLVQKEISSIQKNFDKTNELALFEQRLWQDCHDHNSILLFQGQNQLRFESELDTVVYVFNEKFALRNQDTIPLKLSLLKGLYLGWQRDHGQIDAIQVSATAELPNYSIFVSKLNDLTYPMNQDGF